MATAQKAVVPMCQGCDTEEAKWFCEDCVENLCNSCKKVHQKFNKTKNDNILPIREVQKGSKLKIFPGLCDTHKTKVYELYCKECEQLICSQCLSSSHNTHGVESVESLIDTKTSELVNIEEKFESKLVFYSTTFASDGKEHAEYMSHIDLLKEKVKEQTDKIVKEFYNLRDKQLSELSALQEEEERRYQTVSNDFHSRTTGIRKNVEDIQNAKASGNAAVMIQALKDAVQTYRSLEDPSTSNLTRPEFEHEENLQSHLFLQLQGYLTLHAMEATTRQALIDAPISQTEGVSPSKFVIDFNNMKVIFSFEIKNKTGFINSVIPIENNMAWTVFPDKHMSLLTFDDTNGKVIKESVQVNGQIWCAVPHDKYILVVYGGGHFVVRYTKDGDYVTIFSNLSPFYTCRLCVTSQQDVMVSLVSSLTFNSALTSKVVRLDRRGQITQEIQYRNQEPLFTCARSLTSLPNGDLVVVDNVGKDVWRVICVDEGGNYKYTWNGEAKDNKCTSSFCPTRLTNDGQKVYITDRKNHCVYILDSDGEAEQFMLDQLGIKEPWAISIDNRGRMWIGCMSNIYVLE